MSDSERTTASPNLKPCRARNLIRLSWPPKGEIKSFLTDPYDLTDEHLYEAKGSAAREKVRMAVGQLLDYKRLMETPPRKLSVLLPHEPSSDIRSFLAAYGIGCTWQQEDGRFKSL